jgi:O-antigen/teichoic acid export membrane protein
MPGSSAAPYAIAVVVERVSSMLLLYLIGRHLGSHWLGLWSQVGVLSALMVPVVTFQASQSMVRFFPQCRDSGQWRQFITVLAAFPQVAMLGTVLLFSLTGTSAVDFLFPDAPTDSILLVVGAYVWSEIQAELIQAELRSRRRIAMASAVSMCRSVARIAWMAGFVAWTPSAGEVAIVAYLVGQFIVLSVTLGGLIWKADSSSANMEAGRIWSLIGQSSKFSAPLVMGGVIQYANGFLDRYFVVRRFGLEGAAVYSVTFGVVASMALFYVVYGYSMYPRISAARASGDHGQVEQMYTFLVTGYLRVVMLALAWWFVAGRDVVGGVFGVSSPDLLILGTVQIAIVAGLGVVQIATYVLQVSVSTKTFLLPVTLSALATGVLLMQLPVGWGLAMVAVANLVPTVGLGIWFVAKAAQHATIATDAPLRRSIIAGAAGSTGVVVASMTVGGRLAVWCAALATLAIVLDDVRLGRWSISRNLVAA